MKTYVIMVSDKFPAYHQRKGEPTMFPENIAGSKLHTIRNNYDLWAKRFEAIARGEACLSVRVWSGKPYRSKQKEIFNFTNADGIGLQALDINEFGWMCIGNRIVDTTELANNDGLTLNDFKSWFHGHCSKRMAIIHFTGFRYAA